MDSHSLDLPALHLDLTSAASGSRAPVGGSPNMRAIKEAFRAMTEGGLASGVEALLQIAHDDCRFRPASAEGRVLHGHDEVRAFFRDAQAAGTAIRVHPRAFEERGDSVVVSGSIRVIRPGGSFAERQLRWIYRFREGRLEEAVWSPRH